VGESPALAPLLIATLACRGPWLGETLPPAMALLEPDTSMGEAPAPGMEPVAALPIFTLASGLLGSVPSMPEAPPLASNEDIPPPSVDKLPVEREFPPSVVEPLALFVTAATDPFADWDVSVPSPLTLALEPALESVLSETPGEDWDAAAAASDAPAAAALPVADAIDPLLVLALIELDWEALALADAFSVALPVPSPEEAAAVSAAPAAAAELPPVVLLAELRAPAPVTPLPPPVLLAVEVA
jgi:hypothetical protein